MKKLKFCYYFLLCNLNVLCGQVITDLEIYYLPWKIRPDAQLEAAEVRNFNNGRNSYICINDSVAINTFIKAMSIFYLRPFPQLKKIDHVMVVDIHFDDGDTETIGLNARKNLVYKKVYYYKNYELEKWLDKYVPPAKKPW